jgi:hypothetical protein
MVRFIKQEAEEKANEIMVSAEEVNILCTVPQPLALGHSSRMPAQDASIDPSVEATKRISDFHWALGWGLSAM